MPRWSPKARRKSPARRWPVANHVLIKTEDRQLVEAAHDMADELETLLERLTDGRSEVEGPTMEEWADEIRAVLRDAGRLP